ncbi:hypothetical protein HDU85_002853 [Gaertneriomyces sp. JEL0708]|nr:hypothetical protein HDU85_002853 [Gaertneriomyces sp. JEL0708]
MSMLSQASRASDASDEEDHPTSSTERQDASSVGADTIADRPLGDRLSRFLTSPILRTAEVVVTPPVEVSDVPVGDKPGGRRSYTPGLLTPQAVHQSLPSTPRSNSLLSPSSSPPLPRVPDVDGKHQHQSHVFVSPTISHRRDARSSSFTVGHNEDIALSAETGVASDASSASSFPLPPLPSPTFSEMFFLESDRSPVPSTTPQITVTPSGETPPIISDNYVAETHSPGHEVHDGMPKDSLALPATLPPLPSPTFSEFFYLESETPLSTPRPRRESSLVTSEGGDQLPKSISEQVSLNESTHTDDTQEKVRQLCQRGECITRQKAIAGHIAGMSDETSIRAGDVLEIYKQFKDGSCSLTYAVTFKIKSAYLLRFLSVRLDFRSTEDPFTSSAMRRVSQSADARYAECNKWVREKSFVPLTSDACYVEYQKSREVKDDDASSVAISIAAESCTSYDVEEAGVRFRSQRYRLYRTIGRVALVLFLICAAVALVLGLGLGLSGPPESGTPAGVSSASEGDSFSNDVLVKRSRLVPPNSYRRKPRGRIRFAS